MKKKTILQNLRHHRRWVQKQPEAEPPEDGTPRVENLMIGCVEIINCCGRSIRKWLDRKDGRRAGLRQVKTGCATRRGSKVLRDLIDLAISELEACVWIDDLPVGALPLEKEPRPLSPAKRAALERATRAASERRRQEREQRAYGVG